MLQILELWVSYFGIRYTQHAKISTLSLTTLVGKAGIIDLIRQMKNGSQRYSWFHLGDTAHTQRGEDQILMLRSSNFKFLNIGDRWNTCDLSKSSRFSHGLCGADVKDRSHRQKSQTEVTGVEVSLNCEWLQSFRRLEPGWSIWSM